MFRSSLPGKIAGALMIIAVGLCGIGYGFTCPGSENRTDQNANYLLGMPMGGIGAGNFNFLPSGLYNTTYIRVAAATGVAPRCLAFQKRGATTYSDSLVHAGGMTTTFTGYWPTVYMKYRETGMIDSIALECFSPIIAGDGIENCNKNSSLPLAIYIFTVTNNSSSYDTAAVALSNSANATVVTDSLRPGRVIGIKSTTICIMVDTAKSDPADSITCGSTRSQFTASGRLDNAAAGILAKRIVLAPNSSRTIAFAVSWTSVTNGYYRNYFTDAQALAAYGRDSAMVLKAKVDRWHNKILKSNLPGWLQDLAINCLHVYNCMTDWTTATTAGVAGTYGMAESMSSGNYGTNDQAYHAHFALPLFAPQAEWSQVARMAGSQQSSGLFAHLYTGDNSLRSDEGQKYILEVLKAYQWTGNATQLRARYATMQSSITGIRAEDTRNSDGLTDDSAMITYDNPYWDGWNIPSKEYDNELYLGALKAMIRAAVANGTPADTTNYVTYFNQTSLSFERANSTTYANSGYWDSTDASSTGRRGYYTGSSNINIPQGKAVWDGGLMGQWCADVCGLGPLHPESRLESAFSFINDACLDQSNPPVYSLMMAYPNTNCSGTTPSGNYFNYYAPTSTTESNHYCTYCSYGPAEMCGAFGHNLADISMRALHSFWNVMFSKYLRVFNMPCKMTNAGAGIDWGLDRYMNPPGCFGAVFGITGFTIDVTAKELRIKPSLPTSTQYKMDSLVGGPLMNPISCGTVDYKRVTTSTPNIQRYVVRFDNPMQFNTFYAKRLYNQVVAVRKPAVGGSTVAATIAVNSADTSEYMITFGSTLTIDSSGVLIIIGDNQVGTRFAGVNAPAQIAFTVDTKRGIISYNLQQRESVTLSLVNSRGERILFLKGQGSAGTNVVRYDWKNRAAGVYYAQIKTGGENFVKKVVYMK